VPWSLEQAYDAYPRIEEEFSAALDQSLDPRGPDLLYDLVARLGLAPGAVALDVGCGEGRQALALHQRFGFHVTGIDPVPRVPVRRRASRRGRRVRLFAQIAVRHADNHRTDIETALAAQGLRSA
jgi:SAM-dependent methyltransferase